MINAHKFLLSSASNVFKNIFSDSALSPQMVFIRGVHFEDLAALVNFIYFGEVTVAAEHIDSFFSTARDLEIKGLMNESHPLSRESSLSRDIIKAEGEDNDHVSKVLTTISMILLLVYTYQATMKHIL